MMKDIINQVASQIGAEIKPGSFILHTGRKTPLERSRFRSIESLSTSLKTAFIDGGNAPILRTPSQECHMSRTAAVFYEGLRKIGITRKTSLTLGTCDGHMISLKSFGEEHSLAPIPITDNNLRTGDRSVTISTAIELARHVSERNAAKTAAGKITDGMLIVDGDLTDTHPLAKKATSELENECKKTGSTLIGCAKTNTACTNTGISAIGAVSQIAPEGIWAYDLEPKDERHKAIVKLHPTARHCFLIESPDEITNATLCALAALSKDLAFPGYPYGLIAADQLARVSNKERDMAAIEIQTKASKLNKSIPNSLSGSDAHSILDRMQF